MQSSILQSKFFTCLDPSILSATPGWISLKKRRYTVTKLRSTPTQLLTSWMLSSILSLTGCLISCPCEESLWLVNVSPARIDLWCLFGDAYFRNKAISLTQEGSCLSSSSSASGVDRAFYVYPIRFLDSETNSTASFSCPFSFSIISSPLCPFGDGIAFLITSNAEYMGTWAFLDQP